MEKLAKTFRNLYGTFSDQDGENIVLFAKNVDKYMQQSLIPSLEMGMIVITCLKGTPYVRARRWMETTDRDPDRIHADHWCAQPHQRATPFLPFQPAVAAIEFRAPRAAGIGADGNPEQGNLGDPGQEAVNFQPMRPSVAAVREQSLDEANHCLKHYLMNTFRKCIDLSAADKYLSTFKIQKPKQSCSVYIDVFITKFEYYSTIQWTATERALQGHLDIRNAVALRYIREGLCEEFRMHLDRHPEIVTFIEIDDEIIRWSRDTVEGRKITNSCDKVEAKHTASSFFHGHPIVQEEEEQEQDNQYSSSSTDNQDQRNGATRGRGGARGRGASNRNPNQPRGTVWSKDADGFNQYHQGNDGKILLNEKGHPHCNYCSIPCHNRGNCRIRLKDVQEGIKRAFHPSRGQLQSNNQQRRLMLARESAEPWANRSTASAGPQTPQPQPPMTQWNDFLNATPPLMSQFAIDIENQQWLGKVASAGCDPNSILTTARQAHQTRHYQTQQPNRPASVASTSSTGSTMLPSGLVACNECWVISSNMELAEAHTSSVHTFRQLSLTHGSGHQI